MFFEKSKQKLSFNRQIWQLVNIVFSSFYKMRWRILKFYSLSSLIELTVTAPSAAEIRKFKIRNQLRNWFIITDMKEIS